ncbi:uncharacterized protein LOC132194801 [Neocloeon triangulifer]|uniref:uncharacterized protein LOC132194801 n=1 Tax=Neocloeon triangulifer TaxID=2078957 RepID=UPI00286EC024|nr:uncharacterized protein LOC132194801 [Neocloeon triangulifer]
MNRYNGPNNARMFGQFGSNSNNQRWRGSLDQVKWMYMCGNKDWKEFDPALQAQLEACYASGGNKFSYTLKNDQYDADFMKWKQVKRSDPTKVRNIKREVVKKQSYSPQATSNSSAPVTSSTRSSTSSALSLSEILNCEVTLAVHHLLKLFVLLIAFIIFLVHYMKK